MTTGVSLEETPMAIGLDPAGSDAAARSEKRSSN
jgi:hypothetical protein